MRIPPELQGAVQTSSYLCFAWREMEGYRLYINLPPKQEISQLRCKLLYGFFTDLGARSLPAFTQVQMGKVKWDKGLKNHSCGQIQNFWTEHAEICSLLNLRELEQLCKERWTQGPFTPNVPLHILEDYLSAEKLRRVQMWRCDFSLVNWP